MSTFVTAMYHNISDTDQQSVYTLGWREFHGQLQALRATGLGVGSFSDLEEHEAAGQALPRVVLTFDDGHASNLDAAREIAALGMRCTVFVTPKFCLERAGFMKAPDLRALCTVADVGAHGFSHAPLTKLGDVALRAELADSKSWIEDAIGSEVRYMSAPGGYLNRRVLAACRAAGYRLVGNSVEWWTRVPSGQMPTSINRIALRRGWPARDFEAIVRRRASFYLRRRLRGTALALPKAILSDAMIRRMERLRRH